MVATRVVLPKEQSWPRVCSLRKERVFLHDRHFLILWPSVRVDLPSWVFSGLYTHR